MDNHSSHISVNALNLAKDHGVHIRTRPPHTSHKTQPLDRRHITMGEMVCFIGASWMKEATPANITSRFRISGIWPFDIKFFLMLILRPHCILNSQHVNQTTLMYSIVKFPQIQVHYMVMEFQSKEQRNSNAIEHL